MKKSIVAVLCCFLLASCQRPATFSDWSPINDAATPRPALTETQAVTEESAQTPITGTSTAQPTLDFDDLPGQLPESAKGYELVSWQDGDAWYFTLVSGTNREKTFEELMSPESQVAADGLVKITVSGSDQIKRILALLPAGTEVFWSGMDLSGQVPEGTLYFSFPPQSVIDELTTFCSTRSITLSSLAEPE